MDKRISFSSREKELLQQLSVGAVMLFGSRAQGLEYSLSDFDFGVIVSDSSILYSPEKRKKIYDALYDILSSKIKQLATIDIVFLEDAPFELRAHVMKYGKVLFEARQGIFADFKADVMERYADFAPLKKIFHTGVLSQIF